MRRVAVIVMLLPILLLMAANTDPFRDADAAYNNGSYSEALKLYQREAVSATKDTVRAEAWFRSAYCQYAIGKTKEAIISLENTITLNEKIQVDPNIYPPDFVELFEIAQLRSSLLDTTQTSSHDIPDIQIPGVEVELPDVKRPPLTFAPLPFPETTPFYTPLDRYPVMTEREIPTKMEFSGEIVVSLTADSTGTIQDINTVFSEYPGYDRSLLAYARKKWKVNPGTLNGRKVPTIMAFKLNLESKFKGIKVIRANVHPVLKDDHVPSFLPETFLQYSDKLPAGSTFYGPEKLDYPGGVKKVKAKFDNMDTRGVFKGIARVNASGRITQFMATEATVPAAIPAIRDALKVWIFTPAKSGGKNSACYLNVDIELLFSINSPDLVSSEQFNLTILPR